MARLPRRTLLRGSLYGAAVSVGLPFLDCFLDDNGTALAATGAQLPVCFGTWFWGCGTNPGNWKPEKVGANYEMRGDFALLQPFQKKMNVISGTNVVLDDKPLLVHFTGSVGVLAGSAPRGFDTTPPTIDTLIADVIGKTTRFKSIEVCCTGNPAHTQSRRVGNQLNPGEATPLALYTRIFGSGFVDPNAANFVPDPKALLRKSALSAVGENRKDFEKTLGANDRQRLDQYFTSLRELEQGVEAELQKPAPLEACTVPSGNVSPKSANSEIEAVKTNHKLFAGLLAHALACGQTRVANMVFGDSNSSLRRAGESQTHHIYTHEEPSDPKTGYQSNVGWFVAQCMGGLAYFLETLDGIREGDATLLDRMGLVITTDTSYARYHSIHDMPILTAGRAGGRLKTGLHIAADGDPSSRLGLTVQQAYGLPISVWGTDSMRTTKTITDIIA